MNYKETLKIISIKIKAVIEQFIELCKTVKIKIYYFFKLIMNLLKKIKDFIINKVKLFVNICKCFKDFTINKIINFYNKIKSYIIKLLEKLKNLISEIWEEKIKEFLIDIFLVPCYIFKMAFSKYLVVNIYLFLVFFIFNCTIVSEYLIKFNPNIISIINGILIAIFTAVNLTEPCKNYYINKDFKKIEKPFIIDILRVFNHISNELAYFKFAQIGGFLIHKTNSNTTNIKYDDPKLVIANLKDIKEHIEVEPNIIGICLLYYAFVCFMEKNNQNLEDLKNIYIPNLLTYMNNTTAKVWLAHLERVCTSLLRKYDIIVSHNAKNEIFKLHLEYKNLYKTPFINNENTDDRNTRLNKLATDMINKYDFKHKELFWQFNINDIRKDIIFLIEIILEWYPRFIKIGKIKPIKE